MCQPVSTRSSGRRVQTIAAHEHCQCCIQTKTQGQKNENTRHPTRGSRRTTAQANTETYSLVVRAIRDIIKILDALLVDKIPQDVHVAVGPHVLGENVVVWDDDHLLRVPHLGVLPKLALKHPNRPRPAHVVRHEHVRVDPNVVPRPHRAALRCLGQDFLRQRHWRRNLHAGRRAGRPGRGDDRLGRPRASAGRPTARQPTCARRGGAGGRGAHTLAGKGRGGHRAQASDKCHDEGG